MSQAPQTISVIRMVAPRTKIFAREAKGRFANWRWACVWMTQLVFYGLPWLQWNNRQAVLFDLAARKFYLFGLVLWPQDLIYLALLLIIAAFALFLFTAVAGRVWCGFACPQTVYTEIFMWFERKIEGERSARIRLDRQPWNAEKLAKRSAKHGTWIAFSLWTGFSFVAYFTPARTLAVETVSLALGPWQWFWILFYGLATYGNAGWLREQVCRHMCPYARFQSAMFDPDTLTVSYDRQRGEPRSALAVSAKGNASGSCIDCSMCVQVCPTGIDIRNGLQYDCIGCAACIDACDSVMDRVGAPRGLIRFTTDNALRLGMSGKQIASRVLRPRVVIYTAIFALTIAAFWTTLLTRTPLMMDVIRDRGAMAREVEDGAIENVYRLRIMNTDEQAHRYRISVAGINGISLVTPSEVTLEGTETRAVPATVRVPQGAGRNGSNAIQFRVYGIDQAGVQVEEKASFHVPR